MNISDRIKDINWPSVGESLNQKGFARVEKFLTPNECTDSIASYHQPNLYRKTITMERYRFGLGEYKYFNYPLPSLIQSMRESIYPNLAPVANGWMQMLSIDKKFPYTLSELHAQCREQNQIKPTVLILKYGEGGHNTLHQDLYGEVFFPIQLVLFLNQPEKDFTGGEFVMTQQTPRAQSKAMVISPNQGDMLLFTTNFKPVKGTKGYYRASMKHGVSEVHSGQRHTLGIIFHDALT